MRDPVAQKLKGQVGGYAKHGNHDAAAEARRDLRVRQLEVAARELVASWPAPTEAQRQQLAAILAPGVVLAAGRRSGAAVSRAS